MFLQVPKKNAANINGITFVYGLIIIWRNAAKLRAHVSRFSICPPPPTPLAPALPSRGKSAGLFIVLKILAD